MPVDFQRDKSKIIDYPADSLRKFNLIVFEWIDNLCFTLKPKQCVKDPDAYVNIAKEMFREAGWNGEGEVELMWIPPFMFKDSYMNMGYTRGVTLWHVKQWNDGISWMLSPIPLEKI